MGLLPCDVCLECRGDVGGSLLCGDCARLSWEARCARFADAREVEVARREQCGLTELLRPLPETLAERLAPGSLGNASPVATVASNGSGETSNGDEPPKEDR